jgi:opacity protein-like surface antigen
VSGSLSYNGVQLAAGAVNFNTADAEAVGVSLDNAIGVYSLNGSYDFAFHKSVTPYLGGRIGLADIQHAKSDEMVVAFHGGLNIDLKNNLYAGLRATLKQISEPTDKTDIHYGDVIS